MFPVVALFSLSVSLPKVFAAMGKAGIFVLESIVANCMEIFPYYPQKDSACCWKYICYYDTLCSAGHDAGTFPAVNRNSSVKELCPVYNALKYAGLQRKLKL